MPKKKDQVFYQLTVTEKQLRLIKTALEEYFRLGLNQWWDLADRLAMIGVDLSPNAMSVRTITERNISVFPENE